MATLTINNTVCNFTPTIEYGLLYNWWVLEDSRNLANTGWSVASRDQVRVLLDYAGAAGVYTTVNTVGGKFKETGTTYFDSPNTAATNELGFNFRGAGRRSNTFREINKSAYFGAGTGAFRYLYLSVFDDDYIAEYIDGTQPTLAVGLPVRLIKDSTTLTNGQTGNYTGNDGHVYQTICIGAQEWLAENLAETKFRTGDVIPEETDDATWYALTSGALCAYDNDWNYVGRAKPAYY